MFFEDPLKRFMISDQIKTWMASQEMATLFSGPGKAKALELDGCIAAFRVGERAGTALDKTEMVVSIILDQSEAEAIQDRGVAEELCREAWLKELHNQR